MVAAVLVALVALDTFWTGLLIARVKRLQDIQLEQATQIVDLVEVSAEHDHSIQFLDRKCGGPDE